MAQIALDIEKGYPPPFGLAVKGANFSKTV